MHVKDNKFEYVHIPQDYDYTLTYLLHNHSNLLNRTSTLYLIYFESSLMITPMSYILFVFTATDQDISKNKCSQCPGEQGFPGSF